MRNIKSSLFLVLVFIGVFLSAVYLLHAQSVDITADIPIVCGNDVIDAGEECDGTTLGGQDCEGLGYIGGTLDCSTSTCAFDISDCTAAQCSDGLDNDGDGKFDYPNDPGCSSAIDNDETDPAQPSGGGGGGGDYVFATAVLNGRAYPKSSVTILVDGVVKGTATADAEAFWRKQLNIESGSHSFSVYSADNKGRRSLTYTFSLYLSTGMTSKISGIFIAPTINIDKSQVRRGDILSILGQTAPSSTVSIFINSGDEIVHEIDVDDNGSYFLAFDTDPLYYGDHTTKSQALLNNTLSAVSQLVSFKVGTKNIVKQSPGDISRDGRINIIDFSILLFWWDNTLPQALEIADINKDNRVDLKDLSIMLFYWTG